MAENCGFFASINNDRLYDDNQFANYFNKFIKTGFFNNEAGDSLFVKADGTNILKVSAGQAWIEGRAYENTEDLPLEVKPFDPLLDRIDMVVIRCSYLERDIKAMIIEGIPSDNPQAPTPVRDDDYYDLVLATYRLNKGVINLRQADLRDTRYDIDLCGECQSLIDKQTLRDYCKRAGFTMTGDMETKNIVPTEASQFELGSATKPFKKIYVDDLQVSGGGLEYLPTTGGTLTGDLTLERNLLAGLDNTTEIGSTNAKIKKIYVNNIDFPNDGTGTSPFLVRNVGGLVKPLQLNYAVTRGNSQLEINSLGGGKVTKIGEVVSTNTVGHTFEGNGVFRINNPIATSVELQTGMLKVNTYQLYIQPDEPALPEEGAIWIKNL